MVFGCKCTCRVPEPDLSGVAAGGADASAEMQLKICRAGRVQKVSVRLAQDCGLGTQRLVHWCGAQFQVRGPHVAPAQLPPRPRKVHTTNTEAESTSRSHACTEHYLG